MSRFLATLLESATGPDGSARGMTTGSRANPCGVPGRRCTGRLAGSRTPCDAPATTVASPPVRRRGRGAGREPAAIAPAAQAVWLCGGSVTMLHQPTPRTDLAEWAADTVATLTMIDAAMVLIGPPFDALAPS